MSSLANKLPYIEGLDGIRALAAFLVISAHWPNTLFSLKFGWIGVNIFFVLSGFLITRILVNNKHQNLKTYLGDFFYKRALRIFPIYYLFIAVTSLLIIGLIAAVPQFSSDKIMIAGANAVKNAWPYLLTYTYNIKLNLRYFFDSPSLSNQFLGHLWSLSVEEQFYLVFPFIVYFSDLRTLKKIIIGIIILCPLLRLWAALYGAQIVTDKYWLGEFMYTNTICQADALAMGAAMAIFNFKLNHPYRSFAIVAVIWLSVGLTCFYFLRKAGFFLVEGKSLGFDFPGFWFYEVTPHFLMKIRPVYQYSLVNILAVFLIAPAVVGKPLFPRIFNAKPIAYLGKISYGIYLFHNPLIALFMVIASLWGNWYTLTANPFIHVGVFIVYFSLVIFLAHLSYKYFEQKIQQRFRYPHGQH